MIYLKLSDQGRQMEDKYKSLSVTELAAEDAFIRWVIKGENDQQWILWQHNNPERAESIAEARQMIKSISFPIEQISPDETNELWNRINSSIQQQSQPASAKTYSIVRWSLATAAMLVLLIWVTTLQSAEKIIARTGEHKEILLPESSQVILNAGSKVIYHESKFADDRELRLDGEAFFEVSPGSKFTVRTDQGTVTVLGTSFNVISRQGRFEVSCYSGKVNVMIDENENQIIIAGERVFEKSHQLKKNTFTPSDKPHWTRGKFTFENQPLSIVIDELERQYNIKTILNKELLDVQYTGLFESGNLQTALYTITWPLHLQYEIKGKSVTIFR